MSESSTNTSKLFGGINQTSHKVNNFKFVNVTFDQGNFHFSSSLPVLCSLPFITNYGLNFNSQMGAPELMPTERSGSSFIRSTIVVNKSLTQRKVVYVWLGRLNRRKRKPRMITSCDSCRRRKIGCANTTLPCEPCILYGEKCSLLPLSMTSDLTKPSGPGKIKTKKVKETEKEAGPQGQTALAVSKPLSQGTIIEDNVIASITVPPKKRPRKSIPHPSMKTVSLSTVSGSSSSTTNAQLKNQLNNQPRISAVILSQQQQQQQQPSSRRVSDPYPRSQNPNQQPWPYVEARETSYLAHLYSNTAYHDATLGPSTGELIRPDTYDSVPPNTKRRKRASFSHEAPFLYSPSPKSFSSTASYGNEQVVTEKADLIGSEAADNQNKSKSTGKTMSDHLAQYHTHFNSGTKSQVEVTGEMGNRRYSSSAIEGSNPRSILQARTDGLSSSKTSTGKERAISFPTKPKFSREQMQQPQHSNIEEGPLYASMDEDFNSTRLISRPLISTSRSMLANITPPFNDSRVSIISHPREPSSVHQDNSFVSAFTHSQVHSSFAPPHFAPTNRTSDLSYSILKENIPSHVSSNIALFSETTFQNPLLMSLTNRPSDQAMVFSENQISIQPSSASHQCSHGLTSAFANDSAVPPGTEEDPPGVSKIEIPPSYSIPSGEKSFTNRKSTVSSLEFLLQPWSPSSDNIVSQPRSTLALSDSCSPALSSSITTAIKTPSGTRGKDLDPMGPPPVPLHRRHHPQDTQNEEFNDSIIDLLKIPTQGMNEDRSMFEDAFKKSVGWILPWASDNLNGLGENARTVVWSIGARLMRWENEAGPFTNGGPLVLSKRYLHLAKARVALDSFSIGKAEEGIAGLETACLIAWSESFSKNDESAWTWCGLALQLAENIGVYSMGLESSPHVKSLIASLSGLSTLLSLRHCRPSIFPPTLRPFLPDSHTAPSEDPLQAMLHLLLLLTPLLPILHSAKTGSDVPDEARKTIGTVLKDVYNFWGEMKVEGGFLNLDTSQSQTSWKGEKIESMGYGKKVLLETWVQGVFALLNSEDLLPPSILPDDRASEVALSATMSISASLETISSLHYLRLAAISPLINVPVQFALDLFKARARKATEAVPINSGGEPQGQGEDNGGKAGEQSIVEQQMQGQVDICSTFLARSGKLLRLE